MKYIILTVIIIFGSFSVLYADNQTSKENEILKNLRCLVCQGQSIAESNSDFAQTLKTVVRDKISQGNTKKEIYEFLAHKYGSWILYEPSFDFKNLILWIVPYLFLILGGLLLFFFIKRRN